MQALKKPAVRGAVWIIASYGVSQSLRFASNLILTRLLIPEYFGLMALANTLRIGLELMADLGIEQSIIQNKRGDEPAFLNTAWTLKIIRGVLLWFICLAITMPVAHWYEDDRLRLIVPIVGLTTILEGFSSTAIATLNRRMELGRFVIFEWFIQVFNLAVLMIWSWLSPSIWALSIGGLSGAILQSVASHFLLPGQRNRFAWDREAAEAIFVFGQGMFFVSALMFLADQADRFLLAKLVSFEMLGVYTIAYTMATLPREILRNLSYRVLFPTAAKHAELPRQEMRQITLRQRFFILLGTALGLAFLTGLGDEAIRWLYDERYVAATWMLPILAVGVWFSALFYTATPALLAIGKPGYSAYGNLGRLIMVTLGLQVGYHISGIVGAVVGIALSDVAAHLTLYYGLWRERLLFLAQDIQMTALYLVSLSIVLAGRYALGWGTPIDLLF